MAIRAASCRCSVALGIVALSAASSPAGAGVWTLEPAMSASTEYSTNPLLRTEQPQYGASLVANLGLPAQWDDGAGHVELAPRARLAEAGGDSAIGGSGYYLSALGEQKSERSESTASIRWSDDSSAIREPAAGTLVRSTVRERFWDGSLKWAHAWSDRTQSVLAATWQDLTYGAVRMPGLFDYRYATSAASLSTAPSERSSLRLDLAESRYEVKEFGNAQSNTSLQAGWSRRLSVPWTYQLAFGWSRLESSASSAHPAGPTYLASTQYGGELVDWAASISRSVQPSGFGTLALTLESSTSFTLRTSERSSYSLACRWVRTTDSFNALSYADRSYASTSLSGSWRASELWDLGAQLSWRYGGVAALGNTPAAAGRGYGVALSALRRFGRLRLT